MSDTQPSSAGRDGWYRTSYRKLFFDFHSSQYAAGLAADFDAESWADRCRQAGAQAVSVFVKGARGWSFYRKGSVRYVHPHLPPGLDMLGDQIDAFHRRGMKAIGYYHVFNSEPVARDHPDWVGLGPGGQPPEPNAICMQGPVLDEWMLPHLDEVMANYDLDAMFFDGAYPRGTCHCPACLRRFREATGADVPASPDSEAWPAYVRWSLDDYRRIRKAICDVLHSHKPDLPASFNWVYTMRMPETVPDHIGNLMLDVPPEDQAFNGSYEARHWALTGLPFDIMNSAFLQWWGDWSCKPAVCLKHEVAPALASGGLSWVGYQMTHTFDVAPAVMDQLGQCLGFVAEREGLLRDAAPVPALLYLHSTDSYFTGRARFMVDEAPLRGAHRLFLETGLPHHFVDETWLLAHLQAPAAERAPIVVFARQRRLGPELVSALDAYVREGGGLLVVGDTGILDADLQPTGRFDLEGLTGVRPAGRYDQSHCYLAVTDPEIEEPRLPMRHLIEAPATLVDIVADDVQVLADLWAVYLREDGQFLLRWSPPGEPTGHPAITFRRVGKGAVAYVAPDVFRGFHTKGEWPLKHIVDALVRRLAPGFPVKVEAPAWLEVSLARQATGAGAGVQATERTLVHLVNYHGNRPFDRGMLCIEQTLPVRDVVVRLRRSEEPTRVILEPGGVEPEWTYEGGEVIVRVPEVQIHTAVVVE